MTDEELDAGWQWQWRKAAASGPLADVAKVLVSFLAVLKAGVWPADERLGDLPALATDITGEFLSILEQRAHLTPGQIRIAHKVGMNLSLALNDATSGAIDAKKLAQVLGESELALAQLQGLLDRETRAQVAPLMESALAVSRRLAAGEAVLLSLVERVQTATNAAVQAAAQAGLADQVSYFARQSAAHGKSARRWLWAAIGASTVCIAAVWGAAYLPPGGPGWSLQVYGIIGAKFVTLFVLLSLVVWCAKNYRAERHNKVLNDHRGNALASFPAFLEGIGENVEQRTIVIAAATQAVFTPQATGFASEKELSAPATPISLAQSIVDKVK